MSYLKNDKNSITFLYNNNKICVCIIESDVSTTFLILRQSFRTNVEKLKLIHVEN